MQIVTPLTGQTNDDWCTSASQTKSKGAVESLNGVPVLDALPKLETPNSFAATALRGGRDATAAVAGGVNKAITGAVDM